MARRYPCWPLVSVCVGGGCGGGGSLGCGCGAGFSIVVVVVVVAAVSVCSSDSACVVVLSVGGAGGGGFGEGEDIGGFALGRGRTAGRVGTLIAGTFIAGGTVGSVAAMEPLAVVVVVVVVSVAVGRVKFVVVSTAVFVAASPGPPSVDVTPVVEPSCTT